MTFTFISLLPHPLSLSLSVCWDLYVGAATGLDYGGGVLIISLPLFRLKVLHKSILVGKEL